MAAPFETTLSPKDEKAFQEWKKVVAPRDSGQDYDWRGAFLEGLAPDHQSGHWPDTFKKPNHPTFSVESQYAKDRPDLAGTWAGQEYIPPAGVLDEYVAPTRIRNMSQDSYTDAAVAPLDGTGGSGGIAPSGPGQSLLMKLLPQLLPALITGTGAALTSPIKSGPLIAGRAMLGGLEGWQQATPSQQDLYYQERTQRSQDEWGQLQKQMADRNAYAATIADQDEREAFKIAPEKYAAAILQRRQSPENVAYLSRIWGVDPAILAELSPKELHDAFVKQSLYGQKPHVKAERQPDGRDLYVARDSNGNVLWLGGQARPLKPEPTDKADEQIKKQAIAKGVDSLNPAQRIRWDKMNQKTLTFADQLKSDPEIAAALGLPQPAAASKVNAAQKPTKTLGGKNFEQDTDGQWYEIGQ